MFKTTVFLQQHTPMIHFQHDQDGATLRATEVKPKLDKFIYSRFKLLFPGEKELHKSVELFNPENRANSSYKLRISNPYQAEKILVASYLKKGYRNLLNEHNIPFLHNMPYFAQESEINKLFSEDEAFSGSGRAPKKYKLVKENLSGVAKWGLMNQPDEPINLDFFSWNASIIKAIELSAPYFFAYENFGTRQSKGFGCFSVISPQPSLSFHDLVKAVYPIRYWSAFDDLPRNQIKRLQKILEEIQSDYKLIKSGKSQKEGGEYEKSLLFLYGVQRENPVRWEKRKIKQDINARPFDNRGRTIELMSERGNAPIYNGNGDQSWDDGAKAFNYQYIRAVLGLSEQFEFQTKSDRSPTKPGPDKYVVQIKSGNNIERFRSPITFKVYGNSIYLLAEELTEEPDLTILGKTFDFDLKLKLNNKLSTRDGHKRPMFSLDTPHQFSIASFLQFALQNSPEAVSGYTPF